MWSAGEQAEPEGVQASWRHGAAESTSEDRRQRVALLLGSMAELAAKMVIWVLGSHREDLSDRLVSLWCHLQALQCATFAKRGAIVASKRRRVEKEWWVKPRLLACDKFVAGRLDSDNARRLFNMSPGTFEWLCRVLAPLVHKSDTNFRSSIPPRKRIAVAIHRLAAGSSYVEVSRMFAVGEATVLTCTREVYAALSVALGSELVFPTDAASLGRVARGFHRLTGLPNCCGLLTVLHFRIKRPSGPCGSTYLDQRANFSIATQLVVDASMRILNIAVGFPGGIQHSKILKHSGVFDKVQDGRLLTGQHVHVVDLSRATVVSVPQYLVSSNAAYTLLPWLMLPYGEHQGDESKVEFNDRVEAAAAVGEDLLGALTTWGVLAKVMNVDVHTAVELVVACAILHNVLLDKEGDGDSDGDGDGRVGGVDGVGAGGRCAEEIRDALASQFVTVPRVYT